MMMRKAVNELVELNFDKLGPSIMELYGREFSFDRLSLTHFRKSSLLLDEKQKFESLTYDTRSVWTSTA